MWVIFQSEWWGLVSDKKEKFGCREHTRRKACEEGDRDWGDAPTSQGTQRLSPNHHKLGTDSPSQPSKGANPPDSLISGFWPSEL